MLLISHRGNLTGAYSCIENHPDSIEKVLNSGYDCEIDVWKVKDVFFLGHDAPSYEVSRNFLLKKGLWIHCKNLDALIDLKDDTNAFYHNTDSYTLTSKGFVWVYPGKEAKTGCVRVQYGLESTPEDIYAVCTDCVMDYVNLVR